MERGDHRGSITPEKAVEILAKYGEVISIDEAKVVLEFIYNLANLAIDIYLEKDEGLAST